MDAGLGGDAGGAVARAYGRIYATVAGAGLKARGRRTFDLLIAATALAAELLLYKRNPRTSTNSKADLPPEKWTSRTRG